MGDNERRRLEIAYNEAVTAYSLAVTRLEMSRKTASETEVSAASEQMAEARKLFHAAKAALDNYRASKESQ
jgi:hypothetical protein